MGLTGSLLLGGSRRRLLIEQARWKSGPKAGGDRRRVGLSEITIETGGADWGLLDLDEALDQLEAEDPRAAKLVKFRFFAGLTQKDAAEALNISSATVGRDWAYALSPHLLVVSEHNRKGRTRGSTSLSPQTDARTTR